MHRSALRANGMADNNNLGSDFAHYEWADQKLFCKVVRDYTCSNLVFYCKPWVPGTSPAGTDLKPPQ